MAKKSLLHLYCYSNQGQQFAGLLPFVAGGGDHHRDSEGVEDLHKGEEIQDVVLVHLFVDDAVQTAQIAPVKYLFLIMSLDYVLIIMDYVFETE